MFEGSKIFNFFKTVILLEELMYIHIFLCCSSQVPSFQRVNSQTKISYQMFKAHNFSKISASAQSSRSNY